MPGRPRRDIDVFPEEVQTLANNVRQGYRIREPLEVTHLVIDELDNHLVDGPYPMSARRIAEMVGFTHRSVTRQRARRRATQATRETNT